MEQKQQLDAAAELLKNQGCSDEEVNHFMSLAPSYAEKVIGLLALHFHALIQLATAAKDCDEDGKATVPSSIVNVFDFSNLNVVNIKLDLVYTKPKETFKGSASAQFEINPVVKDPELPLTDADPTSTFLSPDGEVVEFNPAEVDAAGEETIEETEETEKSELEKTDDVPL
jgi:hypothetical protein